MTDFSMPPPPFNGKSCKISFENTMDWFRQGWISFRDYPVPWVIMTILMMVMIAATCLVPWIGSLIAVFLMPLFTAGLLLACKKISDTQTLEVTDLFSGFTSRTGSLIVLGLFNMVTISIIVLCIGFVAGIILKNSIDTNSTTGIVIAIIGLITIAPPLLAISLLPVIMATWFAPALVVFNFMSPFGALSASFIACLKNILPFLFYALILSLLLFLSTLTAGIGLLILIPVISGSVYASYQDIFLANRI